MIKLKAYVVTGRDEERLCVNGLLVWRIAVGQGCIADVQIAPIKMGDRYIAEGNPHDGNVWFL